jgi:alkylated DNA repair protein (DNA oxidative demethylase)
MSVIRGAREGDTDAMPPALIPRPRAHLAEGAVHIPDWLGLERQRELVAACREWSRPRTPGKPTLRNVRLPSGGVMSVRMLCLGWNWYPYGYSRTDVDGAPVPALPESLVEYGRAAVADAFGDGSDYTPDVALVNYYDESARMGMHQDRDERSDAPVVSLSLGDTGIFRFGNAAGRGRPWTDVELHSGDLVVFGGPARFAYHGVTKVLPGTGEPGIGLPSGRLNITLRVSGREPADSGA